MSKGEAFKLFFRIMKSECSYESWRFLYLSKQKVLIAPKVSTAAGA